MSNMPRSLAIHAVVAALVSACRDVPLERLDPLEDEGSGAPPSQVRAALEAANGRPEPWTVTGYDLVRPDPGASEGTFGTYSIERTIRVPSARTAELVRLLATDAGYRAAKNECGHATVPDVFGLRLARGPIALDLVLRCGSVALAATADNPGIGNLSEQAMTFIGSLRPPPPPPPFTVFSVPPPTSIRAAFSSARERPEPWTATLYDLVPVKRRDRRRPFATFAIKRTITVPATRIDELVRWLSTEAGYVNDGYACCPLATPPNALGLRLTRGPVGLDLVIQCGRIALGAEPAADESAVEMGFLASDVVQFLETLSKDCSD